MKLFNYTSSIIAINNGNGNFAIQPMPPLVQLSCVNAIHCTDLDGDGKPDIVLGGNEFGFLPQFERLDASPGFVMLNKGKNNFSLLSSAESGMTLNGEVRDIQEIKTAKNNYILVLQNDEFPVLFRINKPNRGKRL